VVQPLTVTGNAFGAISMLRCDGAPFAEDELIFSQAIANVLAVVIERTYIQFERSASEERFRGITTQMGMILAIVDTHGRYEYISENYAELFGQEMGVIRGIQASEIWNDPTNTDAATYLKRALQGDAISFEFSGRTPQGKFYDARVSLTPRQDPHGKVTGIYVAALDLTTYKQVEANKTLAEASEQERRRIGQALHTTIGQELTGLSMIAESNADALAPSNSGAAQTARRVSDGLAEVLEHVRLIARGLDVVSENLLGELNALASDIDAIEGLECVFVAASELRQPSDKAAASLYQIAQEAASNAIRHAAASRITISLAAEGDLLVLKVMDDGAGLPQGADSAEGMGMRIMRYRADLLNGRLSVELEPTGGTRVVCKVPVEGLLQ
jgi:PAS domain S-box-containing protein